MLEQLSKDDKKWRKIAYNICKDKSLADDLVQDMYIKMHEDCEKSYDEINDFYVWVVMKNIYLHILRKGKKEISIECFSNIADLEDDQLKLVKRKEVSDALELLDRWDREILLHTSETSLRKLSKQTGLTVSVLNTGKQNALKKLKELL